MIHEDIDSMENYFQRVVRAMRADAQEKEDREREHSEQITNGEAVFNDVVAKKHALENENQRLRDLAQTVIASKDAEIAQLRADSKAATGELRSAYAKIAHLQARLHRISRDIEIDVDEFRDAAGLTSMTDDQRPLALGNGNNRESH